MKDLILKRLEKLNEGTKGEYLEFSWKRLIVEGVKNWKSLVGVVMGMFTADVYTSCAISGGDVMANIKRSEERAELLRGRGIKVLNPVDCGKIGSWSGEEYMWMWRKVLWVMNKRGCVLRVNSDDLEVSRGCNLELLLALEMGMDTDVWNDEYIEVLEVRVA